MSAQPPSIDSAYADKKATGASPPLMMLAMPIEALFCQHSYIYTGGSIGTAMLLEGVVSPLPPMFLINIAMPA